MLTPDEQSLYERDGLVALRGAVDADVASAMAGALWEALERRDGIRRGAPQTWPSGLVSGLGGVAKTNAFAGMASSHVVGILDGLLGPSWVRPARWGVPLVTFPEPGAGWDVPAKHWHLDMPVSATAPAVARFFVLLAPLQPRGGGTVVVTGSHRVLQQSAPGRTMRSADAVRELRERETWFRDLADSSLPNRSDRLMEEGAIVDGVPVRVVEMTGEPGDVFFMHPSLMHAFSTNAADQVRMMLTQWVEGHPGGAYGLSS
jgi:hypothetical protein